MLAGGLTLVLFVVGLLVVPESNDSAFALVTEGWLTGLANKGGLAFALQMCLVLVTGHALALSPTVQRAVVWMSRLVRGPRSASALVALVSCGFALVHWGLGAIVGAFLARDIARHAEKSVFTVHYACLGAAAYSGFALWHGGFSGSAPLKVAEGAHSLIGVLPLSQTLLSPLNLVVSGGLLLLVPALYIAMTPRAATAPATAPAPATATAPATAPATATVTATASALAKWLTRLAAIAALAIVAWTIRTGRTGLDINTVNLVFLFVGLFFWAEPAGYMAAVADGARAAGAIVIQFPLYFGILGIMKASGLIVLISDAIIGLAGTTLFPLVAFLSAGLVNFAIPSGGGQWAVQADILLQAGQKLGVDPATTVMAFSYGDAWTNLLQPFWALPLLGIMGLRAKDIIGYTAIIFVAMGLYVGTVLIVVG